MYHHTSLHFISGIFTQVLSYRSLFKLYGREVLCDHQIQVSILEYDSMKNTIESLFTPDLCNTYIPTYQHTMTPWCKKEAAYQKGTDDDHERWLISSQRDLLSRKEIIGYRSQSPFLLEWQCSLQRGILANVCYWYAKINSS